MAKKFPIFKDDAGIAESTTVVVLDETTAPTNTANQAKLYSKDVSGVSKVHALDSAGVEIELGSGGGGASVVSAQHSDNSLSPIARYVLNGSLVDGSSGGNDLSVSAGTERYTGDNHVAGDASFHCSGVEFLTAGVVAAAQLTGAVTAMAWIKPSVVTQGLIVGCNGPLDSSGDNALWSLYVKGDGGLRCFHEHGSGTNVSNETTGNGYIVAGQVAHLTLTRNADGVTHNFYLNGVHLETVVAGTGPDGGGSATLNVGAFSGSVDRFDGSIWDVLVLDTELSGAEVLDEYQRQAGAGQTSSHTVGRALHDTTYSPLALYQLQGDGTDNSGNGKDLTPTGTPVFEPGWVGLGLQGSASHRYTRADTDFEITGAISICALVRPGPVTGNDTIVAYADSGETEAANALFWFYFIGTNLSFSHEYGAGNNEIFSTTVDVNPNEWVWVGVTRDAAGTGVNLYLNGVSVGSTTFANAPTGGTSGNLNICALPGGSEPYDGTLQSLKIIGSELSSAQMKAEYDRCFGVYNPSVGAAPNRISPAQITANQNDYNADGLLNNDVTAVILDINAARTITGFSSANVSDAKEITFINNAAFTLTLAHQDAGSSVGNRINVPGGANLNLTQHDAARLMWDSDLNAWRVI